MKRDIQGVALGLVSRFAGSEFTQKHNLNDAANKVAYLSTRTGFKAIGQVARPFKQVKDRQRGARLNKATPTDLFDLNLTEEQQFIRDSVQRFSQELLRPAAYQADKEAKMPEGLELQLAELGLSYLSIGEEHGGAATEYDVVTGALIAEDLAHGDMSIAYGLLSPLAVASAIGRWGDSGQQQTYLTAFVDEQPPKAAVAVQESSVLFDPHNLSTKATASSTGYVLNGEKSLVPLGGSAELYLVAAELHHQPRVFIVEAGTEGLGWVDSPAMGMKAAQTGTLVLDRVQLPPSALLGGSDFDYQAFIDLGSLQWCAMAVGCCQAVLDYVIPYVNERQAFGEPISHRQGVAFMVSDIAIELESMRLMVWRAASLAQQGKNFHKEAFLAREFCAERSMEIGTNGVQLLGGHGYTKEHPVERWYRDLRSMAIINGLHL